MANKTDEKIFIVDSEWGAKYPKAKAGILVINNVQPGNTHAELDKIKAEIETALREECRDYSREKLNQHPIIKAYSNYYNKFGKTYHVRGQVESVIKGKALSSAFPVLTAMFGFPQKK
jgi:DNA/RNA-binding domain of Phe-tRNA-synthetase-like protein